MITLSLTACGGGGGSSGTAPAAANPPPTTATGITASGIITGFSSVFVDGVKYEVENGTVVAIEGESEATGDDSGLRVGMKVRVEATEDDGIRTADRIEYDGDLKGPARDVKSDSLDPGIGTLTVLGQTVIVDANTVFDDDVGDTNGDGTIDIRDLTLSAGEMVVEVSGLAFDDGFIATRIDRVNGPAGVPGVSDDEYEVKGFVDAVSDDGSAFIINGTTFLVIDGANGTAFDDGLQPDDSLVGVFVEVKADQNANGDLLAVRVERDDDFGDRNGDGSFDDRDREGRFEIKGILTSVDTTTDPDTVVIGGTTLRVANAGSLVGLEGTLLELEGSFNDDGVLVIGESHPEVENNVRTEDRVADVDPAAGSFMTRLGLVIVPEGGSRLEDDVQDGGDHLTPAQFVERLQIGDAIHARGFVNADGDVTWRRVERDDADDMRCRLRGPVESIGGTSASDFSFVIRGVTVSVAQVGDADFKGSDDQSIGRQAFFDQLDVGDTVQAQSDDAGIGCEDGRLTAGEVEFEADDGVVGSIRDDDRDGNGGQELTGSPTSVSTNGFDLNRTSITVTGSTIIDDSIIERALGMQYDGGDRRFDQVPEALTLPELLTGDFPITVRVGSDNVALEIEDL
jgi:hypothetical protein